MTLQNETESQPTQQFPFWKPMLIGGIMGLLLISFFVLSVDNPKPEWEKYWMIRPLIVTPVAGVTGGLFLFLMQSLSSKYGINKTLAAIIGMFGFVVSLWLGTVLGLAGTLWN